MSIRYMIPGVVLMTASILGLGDKPSAFGQTLALLITFIGIGIFVTALVGYIVGQVLAEHRQNQERQQSL
ncbi:MAG: hypothetical protein JOY58_17530 [Solirubrobacterales bacterium]|nr:hypothetical protein [Solirubrobacterales bacterium]